MTVAKIFEQAKELSVEERKELLRLIDMLDINEADNQPKTGAEIVATLEAMPPIELSYSHTEESQEEKDAKSQTAG